MTDESVNISAKTRARALEPINKLGYMDGAADGQDAAFQTSFNIGYEQGFNFGVEIAFNQALAQYKNEPVMNLQDPRWINCQMCITGSGAQENIVNLYNAQKEKNDLYLNNTKSNNVT
ncbi:uncharacterized protein LOC133533883 [Cydia pomonella]|uniref:uncharacterized protein LOC133528436 n=1 Tax=Cydia pomonella TaxID=82600 RepID=UPI002ADE7ADD|nr:uncharacterized protein LOC133528436 [Cydia pomonella]XP_061728948.1 uncharacterized protein LOC133533883 [Cydia pomonella]